MKKIVEKGELPIELIDLEVGQIGDEEVGIALSNFTRKYNL